MRDATVVMPWRPEPDRVPAFRYVRQWWKDNGFRVELADSDPRVPFHRAQARNRGVEAARTDAIILADADTVTSIDAVHQAIDELDTHSVIYPHNRYRLIDQIYIGAPDLMLAAPVHAHDTAKGGIIVVDRSLYLQLGGMDERFDASWGYEDAAFGMVVNTLARERRIEAMLFSFDHDCQRDTTRNNPNLARYQLYEMCSGKPELMRELIKR